MENSIIELQNVFSGYEKKKRGIPDESRMVVKDISLKITEGHCVSFLGANGCGKTTLLRTIAGMLPAYGRIKIDGKDAEKLSRKEIARYIAFLSQMSQVYFSYSVYETVMHGRYVHGSSFFSDNKENDKEIVEETLETLGLKDIVKKQITTLSGGQLQRVMLARCIAQRSPVLILDEPMNHLDMKVQSEFMEYLMEWRKNPVKLSGGREYKPTMIGVFHDLSTAAYLADDMVLIREGRLLGYGRKEEMLNASLLQKTYGFDVAGFLDRFRGELKIED